jgi:hypothetical protein
MSAFRGKAPQDNVAGSGHPPAEEAMLRMIALSSQSALAQEISGRCGQAVGTYLTTNSLSKGGKSGTSRSLLALTNGGHAFRFDSDESVATTDRRAFGDSAGTWQCDHADDGSTVRLTVVMLDFTYPGSGGESGQIARIDLSGSYVPSAATLELEGELNFLPMNAEAQEASGLSRKQSPSIALTMSGKKIKVPVRGR